MPRVIVSRSDQAESHCLMVASNCREALVDKELRRAKACVILGIAADPQVTSQPRQSRSGYAAGSFPAR